MCLYCSSCKMATEQGHCHSNGITVMPLLQTQCLCNVPIAWYGSGLLHGAVGIWGQGQVGKCSLGCVWSHGGMKSKGNTHQDSCKVQCPTFLCFLCENPPGFQLFQSQAPSNWSCTLTCCHYVIITWYNNNMMSDACLFIHKDMLLHLASRCIHVE